MTYRQTVRLAVAAFLAGAILTGLWLASSARAHTGYCGHASSGPVWVATPWGMVEYRDVYANGWGSGPHRHAYRSVYWTGSKWAYAHSHTRTCRSHSV